MNEPELGTPTGPLNGTVNFAYNMHSLDRRGGYHLGGGGYRGYSTESPESKDKRRKEKKAERNRKRDQRRKNRR